MGECRRRAEEAYRAGFRAGLLLGSTVVPFGVASAAALAAALWKMLA